MTLEKTYIFQVKHLGTWKTVAQNQDLEYLKALAKRHFARHKAHRFITIHKKP